MLPKMLLRKSNVVPTLSFDASASSTSNTITIPSGAAIGDLAVLLDFAGNFTASIPTTVVPSGWTSVSNKSSSTDSVGTKSIVSYKKLVSGDPGSSITGMNGAGYDVKLMVVFTPSFPITTITVAGLAETIADVAPAAQSVAAQTLNYAVIGCATNDNYIPNWTATWYDNTYGSSRGKLAYKLFNSSPASVTMDFSTTGYLHACIQAFALVVT